MAAAKGWSQVRYYDTDVYHRPDETGVRGLCGAPIRLTAAGVANMPPERRKPFLEMELCDKCAGVIHRRRHHTKQGGTDR